MSRDSVNPGGGKIHLIIIYGPPAVGKLSVARVLTTQTGFGLLHNHLVFDLISSVFDPKDNEEVFSDLTPEIRHLIVERALDAGVEGLILTTLYEHPHDSSLQPIMDAVIDYGGTVDLVQLVADEEALLSRVESDNRLGSKLKDRGKLEWLLEKNDYLTPIPGRPSLTIDNTHLDPETVVDKIRSHLDI